MARKKYDPCDSFAIFAWDSIKGIAAGLLLASIGITLLGLLFLAVDSYRFGKVAENADVERVYITKRTFSFAGCMRFGGTCDNAKYLFPGNNTPLVKSSNNSTRFFVRMAPQIPSGVWWLEPVEIPQENLRVQVVATELPAPPPTYWVKEFDQHKKTAVLIRYVRKPGLVS